MLQQTFVQSIRSGLGLTTIRAKFEDDTRAPMQLRSPVVMSEEIPVVVQSRSKLWSQ